MVFPWMRKFLVLPLSCLMNFCKLKKFQFILLSKFFLKLSMFLLFLCLGTILAPSYPASCQPSYSLPPSSGSVVAVSFHLFSRSTTAPVPFCTVAPAPSPSESGQEMRSLLSATSRPAWQQTPRLAACNATADHWVRARRSCRNQAGLIFRRAGIYTFFPGTASKRSGTVFLPGEEVFAHLGPQQRLHSLHRRCTRPINGHRQRGWTSDLFSFQPRPELGGALWRAASPGDSQTSPAYHSNPVQYVIANKPVQSYLLLRPSSSSRARG